MHCCVLVIIRSMHACYVLVIMRYMTLVARKLSFNANCKYCHL